MGPESERSFRKVTDGLGRGNIYEGNVGSQIRVCVAAGAHARAAQRSHVRPCASAARGDASAIQAPTKL